MTRITRSTGLIALLTLVGVLTLDTGSARAQNSYADFPYQQGSLFYRYGGNPNKPRPRPSYAAPRTYTRPVAPWGGYTRPWRGGTRYVTPGYAPRPLYYYPR